MLAFAALIGAWGNWVKGHDPYVPAAQAAAIAPTPKVPKAMDAAEAERCKVPDFAKAMGHEEKWKLHNNCP